MEPTTQETITNSGDVAPAPVSSFPSSHLPIFFSVLFLLGLVVGIVIEPFLPKPISATKKNFTKGYDAGFAEAKSRVVKSDLSGVVKVIGPTKAMVGTVSSINGSKISIHTQLKNPFDEPALADRVVLVTSSTTVLRLIKPEIVENKKLPEGSSYPSITSTTTTVASLQVGERINVISSTVIEDVGEIVATIVQILPKK